MARKRLQYPSVSKVIKIPTAPPAVPPFVFPKFSEPQRVKPIQDTAFDGFWTLPVTSAGGQVVVDMIGQNTNSLSSVTTFTYTMSSPGVGTGSNRALVAVVSTSGTTQATAMTATWAGTAMSLLTSTNASSANHGVIWIFGLSNPASGNNNLVLNWTGASEISVDAISFTGVNATSDLTAFPFNNSNVGGAGTISVVQTSAVGDMVVGGATVPTSLSSPNLISLFLDSSMPDVAAGQYGAGASSVTLSWTAGAFGCIASTDVAALPGVTQTLVFGPRWSEGSFRSVAVGYD